MLIMQTAVVKEKRSRDMQLQITTDYAIRMIGYLAEHRDQLVTARNMAGELGVTYQYSMKVINQLKKEELVTSVQGCNGGYRLAEKGYQLSFYDIICIMEGDIRLNRCLENDRFCSRKASDYCAIHKFLLKEQERVINSLKSENIVDVWLSEKEPKAQAMPRDDVFSESAMPSKV